MRKYILSLFTLFCCAALWAAVTPPDEIPDYWALADGKAGKELWTAISSRTNNGFKSLGYNGLWTAYKKTDIYPQDSVGKAGKIWDMYGECNFTYGDDQCGTYDGVCDCYNREHSIPKSWFGGSTSGIGCDIFHLVPTDGKINGTRSNDEFGNIAGSKTYYGNGTGSAGSWSTDKKTIASEADEVIQGTGNVFEPKDQYKGDFARGYMGTIVKWQQSNMTSGNNFFSGVYDAAHYFGFTKKAVVLMMKWHREDPVSQKEIDRNNGIQETQGNRNPFIDYPYLAEYIWGEHAGETVDMETLMPSTDPEFVPGVSDGQRNSSIPAITSPKGTIDLGSTNTTIATTKDVTIQGKNLENGNLTLSLSGANASLFSLSTNSISKAQAETGANVTITYEPKADGNHTATLTINGCGVENHAVTLTGSCTAVHTITWIDAENTRQTTVATGDVPSAPSAPADCSEERVFVGWTVETEVTEKPADLFVVPTSPISGPMTYNAVYADKEEKEGGGATKRIAMEDLAATSGTVEGFTFLAEKKTAANDPVYNSGGKDLRIYANGALTISSEANMTEIVFSISAQGLKRLAPITANAGTIATQVAGDTTVTWTGSATEVMFTVGAKANYGTESDKAGQLCFTHVKISTNGGGSAVDYSNYSLACSTEPIVKPDYTVTFINNGSEHDKKIGKAGTAIEVADPATACEGFSFKGWSTQVYPTETTESPVIDYSPVIPNHDTTYYAVFMRTEEGGSLAPSENYKKIATIDELENANYLIVGEKENLYAMSATFTGYYLRNAVVEAVEDVISSPADSIIWNVVVDKENEQVTFQNTAAGYFYIEKSESGTKTYYNIKLGENTEDNKFSYAIDGETNGWIFTSATYPERQLEYYSSKSYWSFYTKQDAPISLYKQQTESGSTTYYTTSPSCSATDMELVGTISPIRKVLINGQLFIIREGKVYTIQGALVR